MSKENPFKKLEFDIEPSEGLQKRVFSSVELHKTLLEMATLFTTNAVNTMAQFLHENKSDKPPKPSNNEKHDE